VKTAAPQKPETMRYSEKTIQRIYLLISSPSFAGLLPRSDLELDPMSFSPRIIRSSGRQILKVILSRLAFYLDSGSQQ
jgi:hypothetical protein